MYHVEMFEAIYQEWIQQFFDWYKSSSIRCPKGNLRLLTAEPLIQWNK